MKFIELSKGYQAIVDDEDYERINQFRWHAIVRPSGTVHALRKIGNDTIWMHHVVLGYKPLVYDIDHKNGNGIDNRKSNLRLATRSENTINSDRVRNASLIEAHGKRFRVRQMRNGRRTYDSFPTRALAERFVEENLRGL